VGCKKTTRTWDCNLQRRVKLTVYSWLIVFVCCAYLLLMLFVNLPEQLPREDSNSTLSSLDFSTNMTTSDWKNWYNSTDVVSGTTMSYFSSSVDSVTNNSNLSTCHLLRYLRRQWLRRLAIAVFFGAWKKTLIIALLSFVKRISLVYLLVHWCDLRLTLAKVGL